MNAAAEKLAGFPGALRAAGLPLGVDDGATYLAALDRYPEVDLAELYRVGRVVLLRRIEDLPLYDAVFGAWFLGEGGLVIEAPPGEEPSESLRRPEGEEPEARERRLSPAEDSRGVLASRHETLGSRQAGALQRPERLRRLSETFRRCAPRERSRRTEPAHRGGRIDLRRTLAAALRSGGEVLRLHRRDRPAVLRRTLLLIDVSRSMQSSSEELVRAAAVLVRSDPRVEAYCLGTRLTRVTRALRHPDSDQAVARVLAQVVDWDGGTRLGDMLGRFLDDRRNVAQVFGATVLLLTDGLERGEGDSLEAAVGRLSRLSHRLALLSPLLADPRYRPRTRALRRILPLLDGFEEGGDIDALTRALPRLRAIDSRGRRAAWRAHADTLAEAESQP